MANLCGLSKNPFDRQSSAGVSYNVAHHIVPVGRLPFDCEQIRLFQQAARLENERKTKIAKEELDKLSYLNITSVVIKYIGKTATYCQLRTDLLAKSKDITAENPLLEALTDADPWLRLHIWESLVAVIGGDIANIQSPITALKTARLELLLKLPDYENRVVGGDDFHFHETVTDPSYKIGKEVASR